MARQLPWWCNLYPCPTSAFAFGLQAATTRSQWAQLCFGAFLAPGREGDGLTATAAKCDAGREVAGIYDVTVTRDDAVAIAEILAGCEDCLGHAF